MKKEKREKDTWYLVRYMQAPNRLYKSEVRASALRVNVLVSRDYLIARTCYKQSNAFLLRRRRRRSAVSPWNVDPLRSTTLRGIRRERVSAPSSALHRKSRHAPVSVMLEKRGGRCRTDGPIRVLPCQMRTRWPQPRPRGVAL